MLSYIAENIAKSSESCEALANPTQKSQSVKDEQNESICVDSSVAVYGDPGDKKNHLHDEPHKSLDCPQHVNDNEDYS